MVAQDHVCVFQGWDPEQVLLCSRCALCRLFKAHVDTVLQVDMAHCWLPIER
jgi:uncharacterized C2H2 Zn-finger protein